MNKDINIYERDIIVGALPKLIELNQKPYPFMALSKFFEKHKWIKNKHISE